MLNSVSEVTEGCIVEVVISGQPLGDEDVEIRPHSLSIHSYKTPTFCDFCGEMLFGMFKQVCLAFKGNFHHLFSFSSRV
jgi:protein kinase D